MYDATPDPYRYPGTSVLSNIPDIRTNPTSTVSRWRSLPARGGTSPPRGATTARFIIISFRTYILGRDGSARIAKGESVFCYPEHIAAQMSGTSAELKKNRYLRDLPSEIFATHAAHFLAALNAIHPFRDGNGRTQLAFTAMLAAHASHPLALGVLQAL